MISDAEYNQHRDNCPKTRKGRAWLAGFLIRNGRACTRAYDNSFEEGDGDQVLALLMQEVRANPDMRDMMKEQGAWSDACEEAPAPDPLEIGEAERMAGFRAATCGMAGAAARWRERAVRGMSDDELTKALAHEIGIFGGSSSPDGISLTCQAAGLKIWISWEIESAPQAHTRRRFNVMN
jgi:hypothetical protein